MLRVNLYRYKAENGHSNEIRTLKAAASRRTPSIFHKKT